MVVVPSLNVIVPANVNTEVPALGLSAETVALRVRGPFTFAVRGVVIAVVVPAFATVTDTEPLAAAAV
jgi:hypothetical protein